MITNHEGDDVSVGMPNFLKLQEFGNQIWSAFGHCPYHVGSSLIRKNWRDVDVRLILPDEEYEGLGLGNPRYPSQNGKWVALCLAFSALGREITDLPIDFQIQQQTIANEEHDSPRSAIGFTPLRMMLSGEIR